MPLLTSLSTEWGRSTGFCYLLVPASQGKRVGAHLLFACLSFGHTEVFVCTVGFNPGPSACLASAHQWASDLAAHQRNVNSVGVCHSTFVAALALTIVSIGRSHFQIYFYVFWNRVFCVPTLALDLWSQSSLLSVWTSSVHLYFWFLFASFVFWGRVSVYPGNLGTL